MDGREGPDRPPDEDAGSSEPRPEPAGRLPDAGRIAGALLALAGLALAALRVPALVDQGFVWAPLAAAVALAAFAAFGAFLALLPDRAGRLLARLGVPPTTGGASGLSLVLAVAMVLFGLLAVTGAVQGYEVLARGGDPEDLFVPPTFAGILANLAANLALFVAAAVGYLHLARGRTARQALEELGFVPGRHGTAASALEGVGWGLVGLLVLGAFAVGLTEAGLAPDRNVLAELITQALTLPQAVLVSLVAAVGEELFFRGFLQPRIGLLPQAALFALAHATYLNAFEVLGTFVLALLFGWAYRRTGSLWAPVAGHAALNSLVFAIAEFRPEVPALLALVG